MDQDKEAKESELFLVRLWMDDGTGAEPGWHGKVQHVATGKADSFTNQASMLHLLASISPSSGRAHGRHKEQAAVPAPLALDTHQ